MAVRNFYRKYNSLDSLSISLEPKVPLNRKLTYDL